MQKLRVSIPRRTRDLIVLAQNVLSKHQQDAANSKLNVLEWSSVIEKIQQAKTLHDEAEELNRKAKLAIAQRDLMVEVIDEHLRNSRDVLTGVFKNEMKQLGEWGFNVIESTRITKPKKEVVKVA